MEGTNQNVKENDEITIDLTELFMTLWSKAHMIILAGILLGLLAFVGTKLFLTPIYTSTTKFYVLNKTSDTGSVTYNDLQTGTQLTKDYAELVKSRPVLEEVISVLNLDMETEELAKKITYHTDRHPCHVHQCGRSAAEAGKRHCGRGTSGSQYPDQSDHGCRFCTGSRKRQSAGSSK